MIVASAVKHEGIIFTGFRHSDIIHYLVKLGYSTPIPNHEQGFIDEDGWFISRERSLDHCIDCGQIGFTKDGSYDIIGGVLTSEDLW